ncbi:MAG: M48 family metalloprotease [Chloroflexota bacterium]
MSKRRRIIDPSGFVHEYDADEDPSPRPRRRRIASATARTAGPASEPVVEDPEPDDPEPDDPWAQYEHRPPGALWRWKWPMLVGLLCGWTGVWLALWVGAVAAIIGGVAGFTGVLGMAAAVPDWLAQPLSAGGPLGVLVGALVGFLAGFGLIYGGGLAQGPQRLVEALLVGAIMAALLARAYGWIEPFLLRLRGARLLSTREREVVQPALEHAVQMALDLDATTSRVPPPVLMIDSPQQQAETHETAIVLHRLILQLPEEQLTAVLAHELGHWYSRDVYGMRAVWACTWPIVVTYEFNRWLGLVFGTIGKLAVLVLWPAPLMMRGIIAPVVGLVSRQREYEADWLVHRMEYGEQLAAALDAIHDFEQGGTGWDKIVAGSHPPAELRIDALRNPGAVDTRAEIPVFVPGLVAALLLACVIGAAAISALMSAAGNSAGVSVPPTLVPAAAPPTVSSGPSVAQLNATLPGNRWWMETSANGKAIPPHTWALLFGSNGVVTSQSADHTQTWTGIWYVVGPGAVHFQHDTVDWTATIAFPAPNVLVTTAGGSSSTWHRIQ